MRAAAVSELAHTQRAAVLSTLSELLSVDEAPVRLAAAKGLGEFTESKPKAAAALLNALGPNAKECEVVAAILIALGTLGEETALPTIHQHFGSKDFKDKEYLVAQAAIRAAGKVRSRDSLAPLIDLVRELEKAEGVNQGGRSVKDSTAAGGPPAPGSNPQVDRAKALRPVVLKALKAITREKWPTAKEWEIWWDRHQATFIVPK
jgi:HEAT repeat protein